MDISEKEQYAIQVMAEAFRRSLREFTGRISDKPPIELAAWSIAFTELGQEMSFALLKKTDKTEILTNE